MTSHKARRAIVIGSGFGGIAAAIRLQAGGIETVAFRNPDSTRVLIALNNSNAARNFQVAWRNQQFAYTLPAGAVATYKWTGGRPLAATPAAAEARLQVYPTVAGRELTLDYRSDAAQTLTAELLDATGRVVLRQPLSVRAGATKLTLNVTELPVGAYVLRVQTPEGSLNRRVLLLR